MKNIAFQKDSLSNNQNALEILEYFENNDLKAQLQAKDTTIYKLKEHIKTMRENDKEEKVKHEMDEIETINIELEHSVAKLLSENERLHKEIEHLKKIYKDQFDSIKKTRALSKEHDDSLIAQLNSKSMENNSLIAQLNSKSMENADLKWKQVKNDSQIPIATTVSPGMFKLDVDPLAPRLLQNREAHIYYLKHTQDQADILQGIVEQAKAKQHIGLKCSTSTCRSQPTCNKKNDRILQKISSNRKNKVEVQPRKLSDVLLYLDSGCSEHMTGNCSQLMNFISKFWELSIRKRPSCKDNGEKSKKSSHQPKAEDTNQENLYLLHMDLCGLIRVESINGKSISW
ncbi:hypothetical protein Tco_0418959 [Tanacetum coccineum]